MIIQLVAMFIIHDKLVLQQCQVNPSLKIIYQVHFKDNSKRTVLNQRIQDFRNILHVFDRLAFTSRNRTELLDGFCYL